MHPFFDTKTIFIAILTVAALAGGIAVYARGTVSQTGPETTSKAMTQAIAPEPHIGPAESPIRLTIPKIGVDANIEHVGVGKTGNMAVPTKYADVGWYKLGTIPGQIGSAVIDGHVDNGFGTDAVFKRLSELAPGDDIYLDTETGTQLHFRVEDTETYATSSVPLEKIFNRSDTARLTLITCTGSFDAGSLEYDRRHVVYAILMP